MARTPVGEQARESLAARQRAVIRELESLKRRLHFNTTAVADAVNVPRNRLYKFLNPDAYADAVATEGRTTLVFLLEELERFVDERRWHLHTAPAILPPDFDQPDDEHLWYWMKIERLQAIAALSEDGASTTVGMQLLGELCVDARRGPQAYRAPLAASVLLRLAALSSYPDRFAQVPASLVRHRIGNERELERDVLDHAAAAFDPDQRARLPAKAAGYGGVFLFYAGVALADAELVCEGYDGMARAALAASADTRSKPDGDGHWYNLLLASDRLAQGRDLGAPDGTTEPLLSRGLSVLEQGDDVHAAYRFTHHDFGALASFVSRRAPTLTQRLREAGERMA